MKFRRAPQEAKLQELTPQFPVLRQYQRGVAYKSRRVVDDDVREYYQLSGVEVGQYNGFLPPPNMGTHVVRKGVLKYGSPAAFEQNELDMCFAFYNSRLGPTGRGQPVSWKTVWEASKKENSPGFPLNSVYQSSKAWFESEGTEMMSKYIAFVDKARVGDPLTYWNCFPKDELTKLEKIEKDDIREINGALKVFHLLLGTFCHLFNEAFYAGYGGLFWSEVGVSLYHGGWNAFASRRLLIRNVNKLWRRGWSIDVKAMDSTLGLQIYDGVKLLRLARMDLRGIDRERFEKLWFCISHGLLVLPDGSTIYLGGAAGNLSGEGSTTITNTIATCIYVLYAFRKIMGSLDLFDKLVTMCVYGDNMIVLVDDLIIDKFNYATMQAVWTTCGIKTVTDVVEARPGMELDFLSHVARNVESHVVAYPYGGRHAKALASVMIPPKEALYSPALRIGRILAQRNRFAADHGDPTGNWNLLDGLFRKLHEGYTRKGVTKTPEYLTALAQDTDPMEYILWMAGAQGAARKHEPFIRMSESKKEKKKFKKLTKEERKLVRSKGKTSAKAHGEHILKMAVNGGYEPKGKPRKFVGSGDYREDLINGGAQLAGRGIGKAVDWLSGKARKLWGKMFGSGDYRTSGTSIKQNSIWNRSSVPAIQSTDSRSFMVRRREFIGSVQSSAGFQIQSFAVNPGLPQVFPWASTLANNFQEYALHGMIVEFVSTISPNSGGNANGTVAICAQYDLATPAPISLAEVENTEQSVTGRPIDNLMEPIECAKKYQTSGALQTRTGALPSGGNIQLYDKANFYVVNSGQADGSIQIGQIWVSYELEYLMPYVGDSNALQLVDHWQGSSITTSAPSGTAGAFAASSSLGGSISLVNGRYTFPAYVSSGTWMVILYVSAGTSVAPPFAFYSNVGCSALAYWSSAVAPDAVGTGGVSGPASGASLSLIIAAIVKVTASGANFLLNGGVIVGGGRADLFVLPISANLVSLHAARRQLARNKALGLPEALTQETVDEMVEQKVTSMLARLSEEKRRDRDDTDDLRPPPRAFRRDQMVDVPEYDEPQGGTPNDTRRMRDPSPARLQSLGVTSPSLTTTR